MLTAHDLQQPPASPREPAWKEFARAPLVPVALAATAGLIADRYAAVPQTGGLLAAVAALAAFGVACLRKSESAAVWLWVSAAALAAAHHHARHGFEPNDIAAFAQSQPAPANVRGWLDEEPAKSQPPRIDPLLTMQRTVTTTTVLAVTAVHTPDGWTPATGRARLVVEGGLDGLHLGDLVEVSGRLSVPEPPANPGERDHRSFLIDRQITADLRSKRSADGVTRLEEGWWSSLFGWLAVVRGWGTRALGESLPRSEANIAAALLLGDTAAMDRDEWDVFVRTGVVHVLAISGQHLVVLAVFVWFVLRACGVRRRHGAWVVMAVMIGYALLTGGRPSAVRAAVMVCVFCGGFVLRRPVIPANAFALAWLVVVIASPTDPFTAGCQLSFLAVFVLIWFAAPLLALRRLTMLERLVEESRTLTEQTLRRIVRTVWGGFVVSLILCVVNAPLVLWWQNLVSPIGVILGPPLIVLTSIALIAGFVLLLVSPLGYYIAWPFAQITRWSLVGCEELVRLAEHIPGGWVYGPGPAVWWLVGFYLLVAGVVLVLGTWRTRFLIALAVWVVFGLALSFHRPTADEARVTFLAVNHGGCVVIETGDGRVLLYDAGTTTGPDAVRRVIAPFLWHRGVHRIDEIFVSHADLDHFNGLPELLKRFPVGQITLTPSFPDKPTPGVSATLTAIERHGVRVRFAQLGDRLAAGDVTLEVLHPPREGPPGPENVRSLVLLVRHGGHTILLTGDLEGAGQDWVRERPIEPVDVMLAPHHGGVSANPFARSADGAVRPGQMAAWARPRLVVSSQRPGRTDHLTAGYGAVGATVWDTPTAGAVTVRSHATGLTASSFRSGEVKVIRRGK